MEVSGERCPTKLQLFRLQVKDKLSRTNFLIDSGADVSVLPFTTKSIDVRPSAIVLFAANGSPIDVIGERRVKLALAYGVIFIGRS